MNRELAMEVSEKELIKEGLQLLDDALARFMECKENQLGVDLANGCHALLNLGEFIYNQEK